jgi:hypothetical protein
MTQSRYLSILSMLLLRLLLDHHRERHEFPHWARVLNWHSVEIHSRVVFRHEVVELEPGKS